MTLRLDTGSLIAWISGLIGGLTAHFAIRTAPKGHSVNKSRIDMQAVTSVTHISIKRDGNVLADSLNDSISPYYSTPFDGLPICSMDSYIIKGLRRRRLRGCIYSCKYREGHTNKNRIPYPHNIGSVFKIASHITINP